MASTGDIRTTITRAFAATLVDPRSGEGDRSSNPSWQPLSSAPLPDVGDVVDGTYRLVRVLGVGNFGRVYVAERLDVPEHQVALKILRRAHFAGRNVERELVMLATVGHPNVVQLKDHGATEDYVWLTMPVYEGQTLEERLVRGPLGFHEAHEIFVPIARGLEALHAAGLRHQDIKPENIFLARFGGRLHPILLDLGVAVEKDATFVAGTALFASPEQLVAFTGAAGALPLTERMDCYCLGATVLLALVGSDHFPGWEASTRDEIAETHQRRAEDPLDALAIPEIEGPARAALEADLKKWMALAPDERPTMARMAEQLEVLLEPEREAEREEERAKERARKQLFRTRLGGAAAVFAVAALFTYGYGRRETLLLASQLENARAKGEERFGDLEDCTATYGLARRDLASCAQEKEQERLDHQQRLASLAEAGGESCEAAIAEKIYGQEQKHRTALGALDADLKGQILACEGERARVVSELTAEHEMLVAEHAEAELLAEQRALEIEALGRQLDTCMTDRAACLLEKVPPGGAATSSPGAGPASPGPPSPGPPSPGPPSPGPPSPGPPSPPPPGSAGPPPTPAPGPPPAPSVPVPGE